jgi:hypothetical protein
MQASCLLYLSSLNCYVCQEVSRPSLKSTQLTPLLGWQTTYPQSPVAGCSSLLMTHYECYSEKISLVTPSKRNHPATPFQSTLALWIPLPPAIVSCLCIWVFFPCSFQTLEQRLCVNHFNILRALNSSLYTVGAQKYYMYWVLRTQGNVID